MVRASLLYFECYTNSAICPENYLLWNFAFKCSERGNSCSNSTLSQEVPPISIVSRKAEKQRVKTQTKSLAISVKSEGFELEIKFTNAETLSTSKSHEENKNNVKKM